MAIFKTFFWQNRKNFVKDDLTIFFLIFWNFLRFFSIFSDLFFDFLDFFDPEMAIFKPFLAKSNFFYQRWFNNIFFDFLEFFQIFNMNGSEDIPI